VPLASVTTRPPPQKKLDPPKGTGSNKGPSTNTAAATGTNTVTSAKDTTKPVDVVFIVKGDHAQVAPVKIGICDDNYWEITEGLTNGEEIVSGGYRAISRDLQDDSKIKKGTAGAEEKKP